MTNAENTLMIAARVRFAIDIVSRRSNRSTSAPPGSPNSSHGRNAIEVRLEIAKGSLVSDAANNGKATVPMPSARFVVADAERNFQKVKLRRTPSFDDAMHRNKCMPTFGNECVSDYTPPPCPCPRAAFPARAGPGTLPAGTARRLRARPLRRPPEHHPLLHHQVST